jgi:hypothetical protein
MLLLTFCKLRSEVKTIVFSNTVLAASTFETIHLKHSSLSFHVGNYKPDVWQYKVHKMHTIYIVILS